MMMNLVLRRLRNSASRSLLIASLIAATAYVPARSAEHQSLELMRLFSDSGQSVPRPGEPYRIMINGKHSEYGVTDEMGAVIAHDRRPLTQQEFVAQIFAFGTYSFVVAKDDRISTRQIAGWNVEEWKDSCDQHDCKGNGFYWIQLLGRDASFDGEGYSLMIDGKTLTSSGFARSAFSMPRLPSRPSSRSRTEAGRTAGWPPTRSSCPG